MILLASEILDAGAGGREALPLRAIDMTVRRNAFGRQVDSFEGDIRSPVSTVRCARCSSAPPGSSGPVTACRCWPEASGHTVAVRQGAMLATAFHPEMTGDRRIHQLFVDIVNGVA